MKGKIHTEEAVIPILQRKGIIVKEYDYDKNNNLVIVKEIGIPSNVNPGLRILGKLDFMKKKGWVILKVDEMTNITKTQNTKKRREENSENNTKNKKIFRKIFKKQ